MKNLTFSLLLCGLTVFQLEASAAPIVTNGTFAANGASYTGYPGYSNNSGNPSAVADWAGNETNFEPGVNSYSYSTFAPSGYNSAGTSDPEYFAFLQYVTSTPTLTQTISLTAGLTYELSFVSGTRDGDGRADSSLAIMGAGVMISNSSLLTPTYETASAYTGTGDFTMTTLTFVAQGTGTTTITLVGPTASITGDTYPTEDFSNVSITQVGTVIPEPGTYALLGAGLLMLLLLGRRFARQS